MPLLHFTEMLIRQSIFNSLCLSSLWESPSCWKQRDFLNFSGHQEIHLYRKGTAQYMLMCKGKHQITCNEKHQDLVQCPTRKPQMGLNRAGYAKTESHTGCIVQQLTGTPSSQDPSALCSEQPARRRLGSISHGWVSNKTFPALNHTLLSGSSVV